MGQVPDRAFGPLERFDFRAVNGERWSGGRVEAVHVRRRDLQIQYSREHFVDVQPVVGQVGSRQLAVRGHRGPVVFPLRLQRRPLQSVGLGQPFHERLVGKVPEHGFRPDAQQIAPADQRQFGAPHQIHQRSNVRDVLLSAVQHVGHRVPVRPIIVHAVVTNVSGLL